MTRLEVVGKIIDWTKETGREPGMGFLNRVDWLLLAAWAPEGNNLITVIDGDSVIWVAGIPFKGDPAVPRGTVQLTCPEWPVSPSRADSSALERM